MMDTILPHCLLKVFSGFQGEKSLSLIKCLNCKELGKVETCILVFPVTKQVLRFISINFTAKAGRIKRFE